jgi:hypothetical protein
LLQKSESDTFYITNERVGENRGGRIRTVDHLNPIQVRYQAALHPEMTKYTSIIRLITAIQAFPYSYSFAPSLYFMIRCSPWLH